ncbi:MAG: hypothetical protein E7427_03750 [Ruminococcaceae bacterium]|nr:hypothetical protein [Oscillospiraceae bacterium]
MAKAWRVVLTIAVCLIAAGLLLLGAAWLTGTSTTRIAELVFGESGFSGWLQAARNAFTALFTQIRSLL